MGATAAAGMPRARSKRKCSVQVSWLTLKGFTPSRLRDHLFGRCCVVDDQFFRRKPMTPGTTAPPEDFFWFLLRSCAQVSLRSCPTLRTCGRQRPRKSLNP
jgi:hypothetical protein